MQVMEDGRNVATLVCMVSDSDTLGFQHLLEAVKEYKVNISVIEWSGVSAILFRMQKEGRGLPEEDVSAIVKRLSKEAGDHS